MLLCVYITDVFFHLICSSVQKKPCYCSLLECNLNTFFFPSSLLIADKNGWASLFQNQMYKRLVV